MIVRGEMWISREVRARYVSNFISSYRLCSESHAGTREKSSGSCAY